MGQDRRAKPPDEDPTMTIAVQNGPFIGVEPTASARLSVLIATNDALTQSGMESQLCHEPTIELVERAGPDGSTAAIVVADAVDGEAVSILRRLRREGVDRIVLIVSRLDDAGMLTAVEHGVSGVLRRSEATTPAMVNTLHAVASGDGALPADVLGRFMDQIGRLQRRVLAPRGLTFSGLTERETSVLRLLAEGYDTAEVGRRLFYSERTVKNIVHDVTSRFDLRNRTHAVAFAIREGYI
jgi:DNA-binding NarL/FixJ family response regulator